MFEPLIQWSKWRHYAVNRWRLNAGNSHHDRLMLDPGQKGPNNDPPTYAHKENLTIRYSQANAPKVERHGKALDALDAKQVKAVKPKTPGF